MSKRTTAVDVLSKLIKTVISNEQYKVGTLNKSTEQCNRVTGESTAECIELDKE